MPLYEYQCEVCGVRFERRQHMNDEPVRICPECGGEVRRLFQPVGIVFKGKGFYTTDSRTKSSTAVSGSSKKSSNTKQSTTSRESADTRASASTGESSAKSE